MIPETLYGPLEMLVRAGISLAGVALSVGFQTQSHFTSVFTRMVDYRRHVLAIFEALVDTESRPQRVQ